MTSSAPRCAVTSSSSCHGSEARTKADNALRGHREPDAADLLPADCPYALDDLLADGWYPANRRGLPDDR